ncbi:hypothetical protein DL93DRAFT_2170982 [Clavulina sp. PMI_390]|nr:hypothetical protein DL93DRAFT_2170982 [Clavulina sp. PMI_390]
MTTIHSLAEADLNTLRVFGQLWAHDVLRGAPEDELMQSLKLFSWKAAFFTGADNALLLPLIDENFGEGVANEYKVDCDTVKRLVQHTESLRSGDKEASDIVNQLMRLVDSPYRMSTLTELQWIPKKDQRKVTGAYGLTLNAFRNSVESSSKAPLKNASEFFDVSTQRQRDILGIKSD